MTTAMLLAAALLATVASELPPKPASHLTPPHQPLASPTLARSPRNASFTPSLQDNTKNEHDKSELQQQEARNIVWAAPAIPLLSSHRGRSSDCNPCDSVPWVPVARALNHDNHQQQQQYALSIPTIQLTLPVNYGIPVAQLRPPAPHQGKQQNSPPQQYGPPPQRYGPPPQQYGPPPQQQYGPPSQPPTNLPANEAKNHPSTSAQNLHQGDDQGGLPPPPLPERFLSPTYGPPQPQTQQSSSSNISPATIKLNPNPSPQQTFQLLPSVKFGPPFDPKQPLNFNGPQQNLPPLAAQSPPNQFIKQFRGEPLKTPVFPLRPIPFPQMSNVQLPPLYSYQTFNDGKQAQLHSYLQPPKPQNIVFTITETDDSCKKCQEQSKIKDSVPAQAHQPTESVLKYSQSPNVNPQNNFRPNVQVLKSVPLAEYLASVEYPMQIIQAPILDVPDLNKYFDLGYHNFPQVQQLNENSFKIDQKASQSIGRPNHQNIPQNGQQNVSSTTGLDHVQISELTDQTTKGLPTNHKSSDFQENRDISSTYSQPSQTTVDNVSPTTRPSQIYHISKASPSSSLSTPTISNTPGPSLPTTASAHFVTSKPPPATNPSGSPSTTTLLEPVQSPSQNHQSLTSGNIPPLPANLRFNEPPPYLSDPIALRDWSYSRGWGNTPPQPFARPTSAPSRPRFSVRPPPSTPKKAKHIHQIIVPYTTNKQLQEPTNNIGWTPVPPTNQGRKVPTNLNLGDKFVPPTGLDQLQQYQHLFPTGNAQTAFTASGADNLGRQPGIPTQNGQPLNLPPQVINHILHLNQQAGGWATGPEGLQQLLASNLQGLLRGEEDSIDIARLQKNIDNWTAEGYKQNQPSVNFIPVTTMPHIFNSKKIPEEYLTVTEPTKVFNSSQRDIYQHFQHNLDTDHEVAESQKHHVKIHPQIHLKDAEQSQADAPVMGTIEGLLNSWSLLDTKVHMFCPVIDLL